MFKVVVVHHDFGIVDVFLRQIPGGAAPRSPALFALEGAALQTSLGNVWTTNVTFKKSEEYDAQSLRCHLLFVCYCGRGYVACVVGVPMLPHIQLMVLFIACLVLFSLTVCLVV